MLPGNHGVLVQGLTGREGAFHAIQMMSYGTKIKAGVTPGKGGTSFENIPVYDTVKEAIKAHPEISCSVVFVPARYANDAILEAVDGGIKWIVAIPEGIPLKDALYLVNYARLKGSKILGPNSPGFIVPGSMKVGIMPSDAFVPGRIGLVSRSGTLTYEVANALKKKGLGISVAIGVGGDAIVGVSLLEAIEIMELDERTEVIVMLGEIGGTMEEEVAIAKSAGALKKPIVAYIAGMAAPQGKRMGHAGAILTEFGGSAQEKVKLLKSAGINTSESPMTIPDQVMKLI
ncbi:MAG: succinate--CoA ligase subunit alpha [Candidatus Methanomethylicia archaeon]|nr:succinate--CoA ligase subunit alpha [Candidatus Methanomethylicia archaeon]